MFYYCIIYMHSRANRFNCILSCMLQKVLDTINAMCELICFLLKTSFESERLEYKAI